MAYKDPHGFFDIAFTFNSKEVDRKVKENKQAQEAYDRGRNYEQGKIDARRRNKR